MFYSVIIFEFIVFTKISYGTQYCQLDKCHDGGCAYIEPTTNIEKCVCKFSTGIMKGKFCGNYEDKCSPNNPCKNNGKCTSGIGHHICDCPENYHGINCERYIGKCNV